MVSFTVRSLKWIKALSSVIGVDLPIGVMRNYTVIMALQFEWDPKKASSNEKKHGVSFEEAELFSLMKTRNLLMILTILKMRIDLSCLV
jgi:hypothetical protein